MLLVEQRRARRLIATWFMRGLRDANVGPVDVCLGGCHACASFSRRAGRSWPSPRPCPRAARARCRAACSADSPPARRAGRSAACPTRAGRARATNPSASYTNAPVITSSFNRIRFGSNLGRAMPAPTSTSVPARLSCASAASWPRPLPEHSSATSNGSSTRSWGHRGVSSSSGSTTRAPSFSQRARRRWLGLAHDDVVDAERLERRDREEPDRPAAGHEPAGAGAGAAALRDAVERDRERLDQRRVLQGEVIRHPERLGRVDRLVTGERALRFALVGADPAPPRAQRHPPGPAVLALAALGRLPGHHPVADRPALDAARRPRPRCPRTRGPRSRPCGRPTRRGSGDRSRRPRSG